MAGDGDLDVTGCVIGRVGLADGVAGRLTAASATLPRSSGLSEAVEDVVASPGIAERLAR